MAPAVALNKARCERAVEEQWPAVNGRGKALVLTRSVARNSLGTSMMCSTVAREAPQEWQQCF